jgi:hypothetical protein
VAALAPRAPGPLLEESAMADAVYFNVFFAITPSDSVDITDRHDAIYVGGAGNLVAVLPNGQTVTFAVIAGQVLPIRVRRVNATLTTATGLVGLKTI